jgi:polycomb protein EED
VLFWDLSRLEGYHTFTIPIINPSRNVSQQSQVPPPWLTSTRAKERKHESLGVRQGSETSTARSTSASIPPPSPELLLGSSVQPSASAKRKYAMDDPLKKLEAHKVVSVPKLRFDGRQVAWSVCGRWCVVAASRNVILVLKK